MSSKLKALGLAFFAVLAMSAVAASAASAETADFAAAEYPVAIQATGETTMEILTPAGRKTCEMRGDTSWHGEASLQAESPELTMENISYTNCHATIFQIPVTVHMNGCHFLFTAGTMDAGLATTATGSLHIECPEGKEITTTIGDNGSICTIHVPPQTPTSGTVSYHNISTGGGTEDVTIRLNQIAVRAINTAGAGCAAGEGENVWNGAIIAGAYNEAGEPVDFTVTGTS